MKSEAQQCKVHKLARRDHEPRSVVAKSGHETKCRRPLDKVSETSLAREHFAFIDTSATGHDMQSCLHDFDRGQKYPERADGCTKFDAGSPRRQSKYWVHEHCDGLPRHLDCREKRHKNVETDCRENVEIDAESPGRQSKCWAQERRDGATRVEEHHGGTTKCEKRLDGTTKFEEHRERLTRERTEHYDGLPGRVGTVELIVTPES